MNKKITYQAPIAKIISLDMVQMIAVSDPSIGYTDEKVDGGSEALSNQRRGNWGNLWSTEK